jgi:hypothetical protein
MRPKTRILFRRVADEPKTNPTSVSPEIGSNSAKNCTFMLDGFAVGFGSELALAMFLVPDNALWMSEDGATVLKVTVELPPLLVTDTGFGLRLQVGAVAPVTTGDMVHERVTVPV